MKRKLIGIAAIFWFAAALPAAAPAIRPQPKAVVPATIQTFHAVLEGEQVVRKFAIRNEGDAPLVIERVGTG